MSQIRIIKPTDPDARVSQAPVTLEWNNALMVRSHSIRAAAREIINANQTLDLIRVNMVGESSTGKSTLSDTLAHLIHTMAKIPYTVRRFNRTELLDFENTLSTLTPTNHIMIFDDVSWLQANADKKKLEKIQKEFTEVRHLPGGQDIKIILILNFHYSYAIPKPLRQAAFFVFTSVGSSEKENLEKTFGRKWSYKINEFEKVTSEALLREGTPEDPKIFSYALGGKGKRFIYNFKAPFVPALWWNRRTLRHIVFPKREWIDPVCAICSGSVPLNDANIVDLVALRDGMKKMSGDEYITAVRVKLYQMGVNAFPKNVRSSLRFMEKYMENKTINTDALMTAFDLKVVKHRMRHSPSFEPKAEPVQPSEPSVTQ